MYVPMRQPSNHAQITKRVVFGEHYEGCYRHIRKRFMEGHDADINIYMCPSNRFDCHISITDDIGNEFVVVVHVLWPCGTACGYMYM